MSLLPSRPSNLRRDETESLMQASQFRTWLSTCHHAPDDSTMLTDLEAEGAGHGVEKRDMGFTTGGFFSHTKRFQRWRKNQF